MFPKHNTTSQRCVEGSAKEVDHKQIARSANRSFRTGIRQAIYSALLGGASLGLVMESRAVTVIWEAPTNVTGASDVQTDGTLIGAWSLRGDNNGPQGSGTTAPFLVNGVSFAGITNVAGSGNLGIATSNGGTMVKIGLSGAQQTTADVISKPYGQLPTSYKALQQQTFTVLQSGVNRPITLTVSGLQQNTTYSIQLWSSWPNSAGFGGSGTKFAIGGMESPVLDNNTVDAHGGLGQYVTGTFTTGPGETQVVIQAISANFAPPPGGGNVWVNVNALQIRTATKTSWMKNAKYGIGANWNCLPSGMTGHNPVGEATAMNNFVKIPPGGTQSAWSDVVDAFDAEAFANQVELTGAGYVIFSIGGSTGLYNAPNSVFEGSVNGNHGPFNPGEFTSKRDLINDLADALNARGIKLIVYIASEGPLQSYYIQRPGEVQKYPGIATHARDGIWVDPVTGYTVQKPAYSAAFRTIFHGMISEWSQRWGSKVAGWWIDGIFHASAYKYVEHADNNDPAGNLSALIAACKTGNALSLVAPNPGVNNFGAMSEDQDYAAGETARYQDGKGKFYDYPHTQFMTHGANTQIQSHYYGPLGTWWNTTDRKAMDDEIINYISAVNRGGGAVSLAVAVDATGTISDIQMAQLERIKAALKPSTKPAVPIEPVVRFTNLALFKPAYLISYLTNFGSPSLAPGTSQQNHQHAGVDGDSKTWATTAAADKIGFSYLIDLESIVDFDRVTVTFRNTHFSTKYSIEYSSDGSTGWALLDTTQSFYTNASGGLKIHEANGTKTGRYLRLTSHLPYGAGQTGIRMGVEEVGVYNAAGPLLVTKESVWVDEEWPTGGVISTAGSGSWQTASTFDNNTANPADPLNWTNIEAGGAPYPLSGVRIHWNKAVSGHNEHGFTGSSAPFRVSSGDTLYCDVYIDPAAPTTEIVLRWKATDNTEGSARWGANNIPGTSFYKGALPGTGQWYRLSVAVNDLGLGGKTLNGMSFASYDGRVFFDRAGKTTP